MIKGNDKWLLQYPPVRFGLIMLGGIAAGASFLALFIKILEELLFDQLETLDIVIIQLIRSFANEGLTNVATWFTQIGSAIVEITIVLLAGAYLWFRLKHTWEAVILVISLAGGGLINFILKNFFQRSRPAIEHLVQAGGYSFPSGHAMVSTTFYGMLGYLVWLNLRESNRPSWYVPVLTVLLILAIGFSRVYLGVHYPSDVVAGFAAGGAWLTSCIVGLHAIRFYKGER